MYVFDVVFQLVQDVSGCVVEIISVFNDLVNKEEFKYNKEEFKYNKEKVDEESLNDIL